MKFAVFLLFSIFYLISAVPEDLTCNGVNKRMKYELKNCKMINGKINCKSYIAITPTVVLSLNSTYNINDESPIPGYHSCLGIEDIQIEKLNQLPEDAVNIHSISKINVILATVTKFKDLFLHFSLKSSSVVGLLQLKDSCNVSNILDQDESCINKIEINSFVLAPNDTDFSASDVLFGKLHKFYFERLNTTIEKIGLKMLGEEKVFPHYFSSLESGNIRDIEIEDSKLSTNFTLTNLPSLQKLTLKNCNLKEFDSKTFEYGAQNIEVLDMSENELTSPPEGIHFLRKLHSLNLSGQKVQTFTLGEELSSLSQLRELNLSNMPVTGIKRSSFPNSTNLETIDISQCQLKTLDEDVFYNIEDLKNLRLTGNQLTQVKPKTFERMPADSKISLDNNKISREPKFYVQPNVEITGITFERLQVINNDPNNGALKNVGFIGNIILLYSVLYFLIH